jgi:hypothetical protein
VLHKLGDHPGCWAELVKANAEAAQHLATRRISERQFRHRQLKRAETLRQATSPARPASQDKPIPLFILGPSRSGKSSLEALMAQIPGLRRGYENRIVARAANMAAGAAGLPRVGTLGDLPADLENAFSHCFQVVLEEHAKGADIVTLTLPANIYFIDRLSWIVPNARFVFVFRDAFDLAFEIFLKAYEVGNGYSYDLGETFEYIEVYHELQRIWLERLPDRACSVTYEDIFGFPDETLSKVAKMLEIDQAVAIRPPRRPASRSARPYLPYLGQRWERPNSIAG